MASMPRYLGMIYEDKEEEVDVNKDDILDGVMEPMTELQLRNAIGAVKLVERDVHAELPKIRALLAKEADKAGLSTKELEEPEVVYDEVAKDESDNGDIA